MKKNLFVHIFTLHLQANVLEINHDKELVNNVCRIHQVIESRKFIDEMIKLYWDTDDLVYLMGDFNVDSNSKVYPIEKILDVFKEKVFDYEGYKNEYDLILYLYNFKNNFGIFDLYFLDGDIKEKKIFPITYGDYFENHKGEICPEEEHLTHKIDRFSKQCLDFIFQIKMKKSKKLSSSTIEENIFKIEKKVIIKNNKKKHEIIVSNAMVNKFKVSDKKYTQLSDHSGVEFIINFC